MPDAPPAPVEATPAGAITPATIPQQPGSAGAARPGGAARAGVFERLAGKAKQSFTPEATTPAAPSPTPPAAGAAGGTPPAGDGEGTPSPAGIPQAAEEAKPGEGPAAGETDPKKTKANPWQLLKAEKAARAQAEKETQELRSQIVPEAERKTLAERAERAEKRAAEMDAELKLRAFEKSDDFKKQYDAPYEEAWKRAGREIAEIPITDANTGEERAASAQDLLELVNLPLRAARKIAEERFGAFADDAMAHRKEIRSLFEARNKAIEDSRNAAVERDKQQLEQAQSYLQKTTDFVRSEWDRANKEAMSEESRARFFKPREGDQEWNDLLEKGFKLVDQAFAGNVMDPKLQPEQRAGMVRAHAAVRNRAAAFGPMRKLVGRLESKVAELEKELGQYRGSTPKTGEPGHRRTTPAAPASGLSGLEQRLRARART